MATATKDDSVLFKKTIFGIELEYTKTDAAIDTALLAGGAMIGGVGAVPAAGIAAVRSGAMMLGRGVLRSVFKAAAKEGAEVAAKATVKEAAELGAKAAAKETIGAGVGKTAKTKLTDASEDALAAIAKAKAAGEAERAGIKAATKAATEGAEAAAGGAAKTVTKEAVESTSKKLLGAAATAGSYAWTGAKIATFPFRHPVLALGGLSAGHLMTDGWTSEKIWDGAIGSWNMTKEYAPAAADAVFEGSLKMGDGLMGFLATGGKKGAEGLKNHLPPGTPMVIREALGNVGAPKAEGDKAPSLTDRAKAAMTGRSAAEHETADAENGADPFSAPEAGPFREFVAQHLKVDASKVNGKLITEKMTQMAKDNPMFAAGMAIGTLYGATGSGKSPMERTMSGIAFGLAFGVMFQLVGQMYPGLAPKLMGALSNVPGALGQGAQAIGLKTDGVSGKFGQAANGETEAPSYQPLPAYTARTDMGANFGQASSGLNVGRPGAAPNGPAIAQDGVEAVDLRRRAPASNAPQYLQTANL